MASEDTRERVARAIRDLQYSAIGADRDSDGYAVYFYADNGHEVLEYKQGGFSSVEEAAAAKWQIRADAVLAVVSPSPVDADRGKADEDAIFARLYREGPERDLLSRRCSVATFKRFYDAVRSAAPPVGIDEREWVIGTALRNGIHRHPTVEGSAWPPVDEPVIVVPKSRLASSAAPGVTELRAAIETHRQEVEERDPPEVIETSDSKLWAALSAPSTPAAGRGVIEAAQALLAGWDGTDDLDWQGAPHSVLNSLASNFDALRAALGVSPAPTEGVDDGD